MGPAAPHATHLAAAAEWEWEWGERRAGGCWGLGVKHVAQCQTAAAGWAGLRVVKLEALLLPPPPRVTSLLLLPLLFLIPNI